MESIACRAQKGDKGDGRDELRWHAAVADGVRAPEGDPRVRLGELNRLRAWISDQPAWPEELFSQLEASGIIQREYGNGGQAGCREPLNINPRYIK